MKAPRLPPSAGRSEPDCTRSEFVNLILNGQHFRFAGHDLGSVQPVKDLRINSSDEGRLKNLCSSDGPVVVESATILPFSNSTKFKTDYAKINTNSIQKNGYTLRLDGRNSLGANGSINSHVKLKLDDINGDFNNKKICDANNYCSLTNKNISINRLGAIFISKSILNYRGFNFEYNHKCVYDVAIGFFCSVSYNYFDVMLVGVDYYNAGDEFRFVAEDNIKSSVDYICMSLIDQAKCAAK